MVKRTVMVLCMMSLMVVAAGTCFAQCGFPIGPADCRPAPCFVPVDCPPYPEATTIIRTWSIKIDGPCPPPGMGFGGGSSGTRGLFCTAAAAIPSPFDFLFGGTDGVYGCTGMDGDGPNGPFWGPVPRILASVPIFLATPTLFGTLW